MKFLIFLLILISCSSPQRAPSSDSYHVLIFSLEFENPRPKYITNCKPYSFKSGRLFIESKVADFSNKGLFCQQGIGQVNFECTNTFKLVKAVLVQGKRECLEIADDTAIKVKRAI